METRASIAAHVGGPGMAITAAHAQAPASPPPVPDGPRYIVTYLEVMPTAIANGTTLVRQFRDAMLKEAGQSASASFHASVSFTNSCCSRLEGSGRCRRPRQRCCHRPVPRQDQGYPQRTDDERVHFVLSVSLGPCCGDCPRSPMSTLLPPQRENGTAIIFSPQIVARTQAICASRR